MPSVGKPMGKTMPLAAPPFQKSVAESGILSKTAFPRQYKVDVNLKVAQRRNSLSLKPRKDAGVKLAPLKDGLEGGEQKHRKSKRQQRKTAVVPNIAPPTEKDVTVRGVDTMDGVTKSKKLPKLPSTSPQPEENNPYNNIDTADIHSASIVVQRMCRMFLAQKARLKQEADRSNSLVKLGAWVSDVWGWYYDAEQDFVGYYLREEQKWSRTWGPISYFAYRVMERKATSPTQVVMLAVPKSDTVQGGSGLYIDKFMALSRWIVGADGSWSPAPP